MKRFLPLAFAAIALTGCAGRGGSNPSFDVTAPEARRAMRDMAAAPKPLRRPVIVLEGMGPPLTAPHFASVLRRTTGDTRVLGVQFALCFTLEDCRRRVIEAVERRFPSSDPDWTTEVDVIAMSMGGVAARVAAAPLTEGRAGKRLNVARLFTISSPHRGAVAASLVPAAGGLLPGALRPGSPSLRSLAGREEPGRYELVPYVRLGDLIVGAANASPNGRAVHWLPTPPLQGAHMMAFADPRIAADIARRLRGEPPFATDPPAPLPNRRMKLEG